MNQCPHLNCIAILWWYSASMMINERDLVGFGTCTSPKYEYFKETTTCVHAVRLHCFTNDCQLYYMLTHTGSETQESSSYKSKHTT